MVRTANGAPGRLWLAAYELGARLLAARLRAGTGATVYLLGSFASRDAVPGVSDVEMVAVSPRTGGAGELAMGLLSARRTVLRSRLGRAAGHVSIALYTPKELEDACRRTTLTYGLGSGNDDPRLAATRLAPRAPADDLGLRVRPRLHPPASAWRRIAGPRLDLPSPRHDRLTVAWLELQYWWGRAFALAVRPDRLDGRHLAVRLVAEPAACAIWATGAEPPRQPVEMRRAGAPPDLRSTLASLERSTALVAERHLAAAAEAGFDDVVLAGAPRDGTAQPLVDWRARCSPGPPDESFELRTGSPSDPRALAAAATAPAGTHATLRSGDLLVMPSAARNQLREVSCPVTDPVSHALARDRAHARFPGLAGWSAADCAARALAEHRSWLTRRPLMGGFGPRAIELLLTTARAAIFHESVTQGSPLLPVTTRAVVEELAARHPSCGGPAEAGLEELHASREHGGTPQRETIDEFESALRSLPCYADVPG